RRAARGRGILGRRELRDEILALLELGLRRARRLVAIDVALEEPALARVERGHHLVEQAILALAGAFEAVVEHALCRLERGARRADELAGRVAVPLRDLDRHLGCALQDRPGAAQLWQLGERGRSLERVAACRDLRESAAVGGVVELREAMAHAREQLARLDPEELADRRDAHAARA